MIAELVPFDQTRVALDLIERGRKLGMEEARKKAEREYIREVVHRLFDGGVLIEHIVYVVDLPLAEVNQMLTDCRYSSPNSASTSF